MRSFRLTKWLSVIMCLVLAACFPFVPGAGRNAAKAENGEKHWYTFSVLPWGIISSTNVKYLALYGPYRISEEDAAVIGRVKGMAKEVKVYTKDPEERLIWSVSPNRFTGVFLRSGFTLPDPDTEPDAGDFVLVAGDQVFPLSDASLKELAELMENIGRAGVPVEETGIAFDSDNLSSAVIFFAYHELPELQRWMLMSILRDGDRLILISWKEDDPDSGNPGYEAELFVDIDPGSELYREAFEAIEAAG